MTSRWRCSSSISPLPSASRCSLRWPLRAGDEPPVQTRTREDETADRRGSRLVRVAPKDVPHGVTMRGDEARLLVTPHPAGAQYFLMPRDEMDADPERIGIVLHEPASMCERTAEGRRPEERRSSRTRGRRPRTG